MSATGRLKFSRSRLFLVTVVTTALLYTTLIISIANDITQTTKSDIELGERIVFVEFGGHHYQQRQQQQQQQHQQPVALAFDSSSPKTLIVLTYQRSGSSFVGNMFNTNPSAFYLYEPIDSLYVAMYGINHGWTVPSDITSYWNGSHRVVPEEEVAAVAEFLGRFLSCNVDWLPTETLTHNYWRIHRRHFAYLTDYVDCVTSRNLTYPACEQHNAWMCGARFGQVDEKQNTICRQLLWNDRHNHQTSTLDTASGDRVTAFANRYGSAGGRLGNYFRCLEQLRVVVDAACTPLLRSACQRSRLRVVKATRSTMASVERLLRRPDADRNLRVVHSFRDPRAVALSRTRQGDPLLGKHASFALLAGGIGSDDETVVREAGLYCRTLTADVTLRRRLDVEFPGRILTMRYEDVSDDLVGHVERVYRFMNETPPADTVDWVRQVDAASKNSSTAWRSRMAMSLSDRIVNGPCRELCDLIGCR